MRTPETRVIDGISFEVTPLGFTAGRKLFVRLSKALGPALAHLAGGAPSLAALDLPRAVASALESLTDADLDWASEILGDCTRVWEDDASKKPFLDKSHRESLFSGRILLFFRWLAFALEVNYSDFFAVFAKPRVSDP